MNTISVVAFMVIAIVVASTSGQPAPQEIQPGHALLVDESGDAFQDDVEDQSFTIETGNRFRRATCDLLSFSLPIGSLNHAACAAHCLAMRKGFRGGRCIDGVCHCRR